MSDLNSFDNANIDNDSLDFFDNVIELTPVDEKNDAKKALAYDEFRSRLIANEQLYRNSKTYYICMRYASDAVGEQYNKIKNEIMSYMDMYDPDNSAKYELHENCEEFYLGGVIAQIEISSGVLSLYLRLDPKKYSTSDAIHKNVGNNPRYVETPLLLKITKETRLNKALNLIRDMMAGVGCDKDISYMPLDYYSFFRKEMVIVTRTVAKEENIEEAEVQTVAVVEQTDIQDSDIITIVPETKEVEEIPEEELIEEAENEEDAQEPEVDDRPVYIYRNIAEPGQRPVFAELPDAEKKDIDRPMIQGTEKSIFEVEENTTPEEKPKKKRRGPFSRQIEMWRELAEYGYHFVLLRQIEIYALVIGLAIALGLIYRLHWPFIASLVVFVLLCMPSVLTAFYRDKYEEKRFRDVETYIEQMLYSFRRNSKILNSLRDALVVFPSGAMHDKITEAMNYIRNAPGKGNVYREALKIIEEAYPSRRIKSLHRYMIKVEGVGGKHEAGISALLKDRRLWIDRMDAFRKQCSQVVKEIIISGVFSLAMACVMVYIMPSELYDMSTSPIYQIVTTIFVMVNMLVIRATMKATVITLQDEEASQTQQVIRLIEWIRNYNPKVELNKSLKQCIIFVVVIVLGFVVKSTMVIISGAALLLYGVFLRRPMAYKSAKKRVCREIEKVYPDWLLELALLLQTDNMHVAIEKTLPTAPDILKKDLQKLADDIMSYPNDLTPYVEFFNFLPLQNVQSSMKLLYSISEFGAQDESVQLSELVERNNSLMDKAERYKNDDKIALVFTIKFIPMLSSSIKMMVDLMLFLFSYLSIIGTTL